MPFIIRHGHTGSIQNVQVERVASRFGFASKHIPSYICILRSSPTGSMMSPPDERACGTCSMCCKVYNIPILNKQEGKWCTHCAIGSGCRNYENRPEQCRSFVCLWLQDVTMAAEWKPEISKMVLSIYPTTGFIYVQVDPGTPLRGVRSRTSLG
jgi:hypothetical protein